MGHYEDAIMDVFLEIKDKGLEEKFHEQLSKMKSQKKHKYKSVKDNWEYALYRVKGGNPINISND